MSPWLLLHLLYLAPLAYLLWAFVHEYSHVWTADRLVGVVHYTIDLRPRRVNGGFQWAHTRYYMIRPPKKWERVAILCAPRLPSFLACVLLPVGVALGLHGYMLLLWLVLMGGGVVDMITNSIAISTHSDLMRAAKTLGRSVWWFRLLGFSMVLASVVLALHSASIFPWP